MSTKQVDSVATQIAKRHFGAKLVRMLAKRGVVFLGTQVLPDMSKPLPYASGETGYLVSDNGTGKVWTYTQVKKEGAQ